MLIDVRAMKENGLIVEENEDGNIVVHSDHNEHYYRAIRAFMGEFDFDGASEDFIATAISEAHNIMQLRKFIR